jgi:hypothetical protein
MNQINWTRRGITKCSISSNFQIVNFKENLSPQTVRIENVGEQRPETIAQSPSMAFINTN